MLYYSQNDPRWKNKFLGKTKLTVGGWGCFFCDLCTLYQVDPLEMLKHTELWDNNGNIDSNAFAKLCGGVALPPSKTPVKGISIGITNKYAPQSPTHFVVVDMDADKEIDPLDFPAVVEKRTYNFYEYRQFTNIKLVITSTWQEEAQKFAIDNGIITSGWEAPDAPMTQVRVAAALKNYHDRFNS